MTGRFNIKPILDWIDQATPDEIAEFHREYDAMAAALKKRFPNEAAVRREEARQIIARAARRPIR